MKLNKLKLLKDKYEIYIYIYIIRTKLRNIIYGKNANGYFLNQKSIQIKWSKEINIYNKLSSH